MCFLDIDIFVNYSPYWLCMTTVSLKDMVLRGLGSDLSLPVCAAVLSEFGTPSFQTLVFSIWT